jgi:5S rRNA maturation endonuclease (ribonuclease M5)
MQELNDLIEKAINSNELVIVEGKKDKRALVKLGFKRVKIISKPLFEVVEDVSNEKKVILLVDLDKEGRKIYSRLKKDLIRNGVKIDDELRKALFRTKLRQIEGICTYLKNSK